MTALQPTGNPTRDDVVRATELRLLAYDQSLQHRLTRTRERLNEALRPRRWVWPAALAGIAAVTWLSMSSPRARTAAAAPGAPAHGPRPSRSAGWVRGIGLVWPLLPARWRANVSPGVAATLAAVGLPLLERLASDSPKPPLPTAAPVDLARFMGTWFEIARLPAPFEGACQGQPTATYSLRGGAVRVENRCPDRSGGDRVSVGQARLVPSTGNAQLEVSLWPRLLRVLPMAWADYWIVYLDDAYSVAVVGHPNRHFCWLLSRTPRLSVDDRARLVGIAASVGFDVERLRFNEP